MCWRKLAPDFCALQDAKATTRTQASPGRSATDRSRVHPSLLARPLPYWMQGTALQRRRNCAAYPHKIAALQQNRLAHPPLEVLRSKCTWENAASPSARSAQVLSCVACQRWVHTPTKCTYETTPVLCMWFECCPGRRRASRPRMGIALCCSWPLASSAPACTCTEEPSKR